MEMPRHSAEAEVEAVATSEKMEMVDIARRSHGKTLRKRAGRGNKEERLDRNKVERFGSGEESSKETAEPV
ncbi:hypothetical protein NL676_018644 [Syzygium grande]|nr:hypothetical protein NL676_018644 [Syzygium grande]